MGPGESHPLGHDCTTVGGLWRSSWAVREAGQGRSKAKTEGHVQVGN